MSKELITLVTPDGGHYTVVKEKVTPLTPPLKAIAIMNKADEEEAMKVIRHFYAIHLRSGL